MIRTYVRPCENDYKVGAMDIISVCYRALLSQYIFNFQPIVNTVHQSKYCCGLGKSEKSNFLGEMAQNYMLLTELTEEDP